MRAVIISIFLSAIISSTSFAGKYYRLSPKASIEWQFTSIDLGKIPKDKPIAVEFTFKNPGIIPLVIVNVEPSCGCTVADYPKQPIAPGSEGKISVTYDSKISGYFSKTVDVFSNTEEGKTQLFIKGEVVVE